MRFWYGQNPPPDWPGACETVAHVTPAVHFPHHKMRGSVRHLITSLAVAGLIVAMSGEANAQQVLTFDEMAAGTGVRIRFSVSVVCAAPTGRALRLGPLPRHRGELSHRLLLERLEPHRLRVGPRLPHPDAAGRRRHVFAVLARRRRVLRSSIWPTIPTPSGSRSPARSRTATSSRTTISLDGIRDGVGRRRRLPALRPARHLRRT